MTRPHQMRQLSLLERFPTIKYLPGSMVLLDHVRDEIITRAQRTADLRAMAELLDKLTEKVVISRRELMMLAAELRAAAQEAADAQA